MNLVILAESLKQRDGWSRYAFALVNQLKGDFSITVICAEVEPAVSGVRQLPLLKRPFI